MSSNFKNYVDVQICTTGIILFVVSLMPLLILNIQYQYLALLFFKVNQLYNGTACAKDIQCRTDLGLTCNSILGYCA